MFPSFLLSFYSPKDWIQGPSHSKQVCYHQPIYQTLMIFFFLNLVAGFTKLPWLFLILLCSPVKPWTCNPLTQFPNSCDYISVPPGLAPSVIVNPDWQNPLIKRNVFRVWTVFKPRDKGVKKKGNWAEEGEKPRQGSLPKLFSGS